MPETKPLLQSEYANLLGVVEIVEGLEYHFNNFVHISKLLAEGDKINEKNLNHEAVAYVNRMGQFY